MRKPGKKVGTKIYVHKDYAKQVVDTVLLSMAILNSGIEDHEYTCIRYDSKTEEIAFQYSPNFDTADEPIVGKTVSVSKDGDVSVTLPKRHNPQIWHHKWLWVSDDYQGFDVEASKARSKLWEPHVTKEEKRKIGYKSFWDIVRKRWE